MKKAWVLVLVLLLLLTGCGKKQDDLAGYRNLTAKEIFDSGEKNLAKHNFATAVRDFEALDAIYPFGPYAQQGQLDVIYAYYKNDGDELALAAADRYIHLYPRDRNVDYAYYMKGLVQLSEGQAWLERLIGSDQAQRDLTNVESSYVAFDQLVRRYPRSEYTPAAKVYMGYIRNVLARNELQVAYYYHQRKAYMASANRASYAVQHFQGAPAVIPSLALMVENYRLLNLPTLANQTLRVLQVSYPSAPELAYLRSGKTIPKKVLMRGV